MNAEEKTKRTQKSMTLGDEIRSMTDDELAKWLVKHDQVCWSKGHLDEFSYLNILKRKARK